MFALEAFPVSLVMSDCGANMRFRRQSRCEVGLSSVMTNIVSKESLPFLTNKEDRPRIVELLVV